MSVSLASFHTHVLIGVFYSSLPRRACANASPLDINEAMIGISKEVINPLISCRVLDLELWFHPQRVKPFSIMGFSNYVLY